MHEDVFQLGDVALTSGGTLEGAALSYATVGTLSASGDNAILVPSYYTGTHRSYARMIGPGRALDPERYFIVLTNMFGNGLSTSPSHRPSGAVRAAFPAVSVADNVACQSRLLDVLGVKTLRLVTGWSMGAMQSLWWAALYPEKVASIVAVCGTANCWPLNQVFLEGVCAALKADPTFDEGRCEAAPERGLRAFARAYAGWAYSAEFFREGLYRNLGVPTLEGLLESWERDHLSWNANDLLAMADTWRTADISRISADGTLEGGLCGIRARAIIMPCDTDAYFTVEECRREASAIPAAELRVLVSPYGHCAGAPGRFPAETQTIEAAMREVLA